MFDPERPTTLDEMMAVADERMYEDKRRKVSGRQPMPPDAPVATDGLGLGGGLGVSSP